MSENIESKQSIFISNLCEIRLTGISTVDFFDEFRISVTTNTGTALTVEGNGLSVREVNPDSGTVEASGQIKGVYCEEGTPSKSGYLKSLLFRR